MKRIIILLCIISVFSGCREKLDSVRDVHFEVTADKSVYHTGEPVLFNFEGNPDFITFYSGEKYNDFEYTEQDRIIGASPYIRMSFSLNAGVLEGVPAEKMNKNIISLLYSSDFSGEKNLGEYESATWTDISDRFSWPEKLGEECSNSGIDISDLYVDQSKPLYFCFRYFEQKATASDPGYCPSYFIKSPRFEGEKDGAPADLYSYGDSNWEFVFGSGSGKNLLGSDLNKSRIKFNGNEPLATDQTAYAISNPIYWSDHINEGRDRGVAIKSMSESALHTYSHSYDQPGEYTIVFVAKNSNAFGKKSVLRKLDIKVIGMDGGISQPGESEDLIQ